MKRIISVILLILACILLLTGCVTRVPTSQEAKQKLEEAGYSVTMYPFSGDSFADYMDGQVIHLSAQKGDADVEAYFFRCKEDTDRFFQDHQKSLRSGVEAFHKFGYVICLGSASAVEDLLR